ncbi:MAG: acyl-CoA reductase [Rikenellaceae bacterium]|nr:acyl-CoA reductase [Rikenellaceae bacterium]
MNAVELFSALGRRLVSDDGCLLVPPSVVAEAVTKNPWFTAEGIESAVRAVADRMLQREALESWHAAYCLPAGESKNVTVIVAGNLPLVGFADLLYVLAAGCRCLLKCSSKDRVLMEWVVGQLRAIDPQVSVALIENFDTAVPDALIATGSDNANRCFSKMFPGRPALLRRNRMSVAVLSGGETDDDLQALSDDVFLFWGMGCRNVSRVFLPTGFDLQRLLAVFRERKITHPGYLDAYRHHRALLQMRREAFLDGGFFVMRQAVGEGRSEALPDLLYSFYGELSEIEGYLTRHDPDIQCVVTRALTHPRRTGFGETQRPGLADYPDGVDVMRFLSDAFR